MIRLCLGAGAEKRGGGRVYETANTWTVDALLGAVPVLLRTGRLKWPRRKGCRPRA